MKLEAFYGPEDFLELVKADIAAKGYNLSGELEKEAFIDFAFSVGIEHKLPSTPAKVEPQPEPKVRAKRTVTEKEAARRARIGQRMHEANVSKKTQPEEKAVAVPIERPLPV